MRHRDEATFVDRVQVVAHELRGSGELVEAERDDAVTGTDVGDRLAFEAQVVASQELHDLPRRRVVVIVEPRDVGRGLHYDPGSIA